MPRHAGTRTCITLLSDFGVQDEYAACLKGVILGLNPRAVLVDLSHAVPPQDIRCGAFVLAGAAAYFPPGTIHLAVVDPGVGTGRRGLAAYGRGQFWVGPDNGLFHLIFAGGPEFKMVSLENPDYFLPQVSPSFHGRDLFAPVAAHLSLGLELGRLGPPLSDPVRLSWPEPSVTPALIRGEIIHVDRFGNLVSNIAAGAWHTWLQGAENKFRLQVGRRTLTRLGRTYGEVPPGELLALVGSHGYLEIACSGGSAEVRLRAGTGLSVAVRRGD
jgi:S-adenosyl-L-methionine hydrolase (adenosine-forming)